MDIQKFDLPTGSDVVVVDEAHVQHQQGYRLIAIITTRQPTQVQESESGPIYITRQVWKEISQVRYVLARDPDEAVEAAQRRMWEAEAALRESQGQAKESAEALSLSRRALAKTEREQAETSAELKTLTDLYETQRDSKRKLEVDIGKVRAAVGELRMKEILGS